MCGSKWRKPKKLAIRYSQSVSSVIQLCPTLCDPMSRSTPGLPIHHQLLESTQTHVHRVGDAIQPSHPLSSPSPPALNLSQHQGLFQWISSLHQVAKVLELTASTSVLPVNTQDWSPLGWTGIENYLNAFVSFLKFNKNSFTSRRVKIVSETRSD